MTEFHVVTMMCFILDNKNINAGHIECSCGLHLACGLQLPQIHVCQRSFSKATLVDFSKNVSWGPKVVKFGFSYSRLKKQFLLKISKSRGQAPLPSPSDAHSHTCIISRATKSQ